MACEYTITEMLVEFPLLRLNSTPLFLMNGGGVALSIRWTSSKGRKARDKITTKSDIS